MSQPLQIGPLPMRTSHDPVQGEQVKLEGRGFYRIANYDRLPPFFMSAVSSSDHWMFVSSTGALTAGRQNPDHALFPYYTDDKIHDAANTTGSRTILMVQLKGRRCLWEPFSNHYRGIYRIQRNLYKSVWGNELWFEEINHDLGLSFRYGWCFSERFGVVRKAALRNSSRGVKQVEMLDGLQNLLPAGLGSQLQLDKSTLVDAYKKNELLPNGLGLYLLSSLIVDRPEPAESLAATTVWSIGLNPRFHLLSSGQLDTFRAGQSVHPEQDVRARRGAYFLHSQMMLRAGAAKEWFIAADVDRNHSQIVELSHLLQKPARLGKLLEDDIARDTRDLKHLAGSADAFQLSAQPLGNARHFHNVLFNIMRGGVFRDGYQVDPADLEKFVRHANPAVAKKHFAFFKKLKPSISYPAMTRLAAETKDPNLERLCHEYLPLTFSRRHGDPSRPWNRFAIPGRNVDGSRILDYGGNWRDIFQNWEALAISFPAFVSGMISKFVNASTADGYNPYRIGRAGIDWEIVDPADPWSHIGYWGDHQVIYLLKLLEILEDHEPAKLREFLTNEIFAFANVPYRIKPYNELLKDAKQTVVFDEALNEAIRRRVELSGSDGKLRQDKNGQMHLVNLTEKLLVLVLAKLSNFVPEAGIWLNTQRPEWNDANNALVGNGASMVTLYYLRRFLTFCHNVFASLNDVEFVVSSEVTEFFNGLNKILQRHQTLMDKSLSDLERKNVLDELGRAGSRYRETIYETGFSGRKSPVKNSQLLGFIQTALNWTDQSIQSNRRTDSLYHSYNLVAMNRQGVQIRRLYEMLEGQVAVLSSGALSGEASLQLLQALKRSSMFRADQQSYLLYPDRQLRRFLDKNTISRATRSKLLPRLSADGERSLVERDRNSKYHFNAALTNARDVERVLSQLAGSGYAKHVKAEAKLILAMFEEVFDHQSFTGRSGTFFGYEGLGCIYWHMVSKLLLAVQETFFRTAQQTDANPRLLHQLKNCYYDIRAGIGDCKSPASYGAFPMDPYSHTPGNGGARQPGLTGQVKEDILCRWGELGVRVQSGRICFQPLLLRRSEFLRQSSEFGFVDLAGRQKKIALKQNSLAFTYCQVPMVYTLAEKSDCRVWFADGSSEVGIDFCLSQEISREIFERTGKITRINLHLRIS